MQQFLVALRKASLPGIWAQGVKLARENGVTTVASSATELTLRVRASGTGNGRAILPTVTLYLDGTEWSCDCNGKTDPCAHVVAAAIAALQTGEQGGAKAASAATRARIAYRLSVRTRSLTLARFVVYPDGREERMTTPLASDIARGRLSPELAPTHDDLTVDRLLGAVPGDILPLVRMGPLFDALSGAWVTLDGAEVKVSGDPVLPHAIVEDGREGSFVLRLESDEAVTRVVARGVVQCGDTLRPLGEMDTTGEFLEHLPLSRTIARADAANLVTKILPDLERTLEVTLRTRKLPRKAKDLRPRIAMDLSHQGHTLSVLPSLVYGDPAIARIDAGALVALGNDVPLRKVEQERELLRTLRDDLNLVPGRRVDLDGTEAIRFASKLREWQKRTADEGHATVFEDRPLSVRLDLEGGIFDVVFERASDDGQSPKRTDAASVLRAWRDGLDLVPLQGGGWAPLPLDWLEEHGHLVADLMAARDADKKLTPAALPDLGELCDALKAPRPLALDKLAPLLDDFSGIPHATLPPGITAELRAYQQRGVDWLSFLQRADLGAVLADDMGLGKTLQAICVLEGRVLVICPKSVVYNWAEEIRRFRPALRTAIYHGPKRELDPTADVTLTTYALLRMDADLLQRETWDVVVLDEAQAIKNLGSQTARAAFELHGKFRMALSGTPVENRLEELWSVMNFANPGLLGGAGDFRERYAEPIANGDKAAANRLRRKIRPFVLRRMKKDVLPELPSRTDAVLHVELDEPERNVYDAVRAATKKDIADKLAHGGGVLAALEALLRLRQAACHRQLVPGQKAESSSKVEALLDALGAAAAEGHKALVFSQWTSFLDLVEPHLDRAQIGFLRLDGSTRDRATVVAGFQSESGPPVMLVSLKAGGTGLNLTAADHVFLLDPWWNPAVEDQAADRAHRIGQDRPVMVYRMVAKDTVEERIFALQAKKRAIADVALGQADHAGGITREELLALLD